MPLEKAVVNRIIVEVRRRGGFAEKIHGDVFQSTLLDILICYRGHFVLLEGKRDEKHEATAKQLDVIARVKAAGGIADVVWSVPQVLAILEAIDDAVDRSQSSSS